MNGDPILTVLLVLAIVAVVVHYGLIHAREWRVLRGRMLAVTGPLVDEESPTDNLSRLRIWERKIAGTHPTFRPRAGWNRRA